MKLSTKGRYGLRAAAELAVCHGQSAVPLRQVAGPGASCANMASCATRRVWEKMQNSLNQVMDSITLQDMLEDELRMRAQCGKAAGGCECTTVHKKEENSHG